MPAADAAPRHGGARRGAPRGGMAPSCARLHGAPVGAWAGRVVAQQVGSVRSGPDAHALEAKVAFLRRAEAYPETPIGVEVLETHMSWVFLTDRHAYKLKKPVRFDSLDFSTVELRRRDCEEEVRLNRRLAPDVYLGTLALTADERGALSLGGAGEVVDWLVWMRRLPADRMLDARVLSGALRRAEVRPAALRLARFFAEAERVTLAPAEYRRRLAEGVEGDRRALSRPEFGLPRERVEALARAEEACLERHAALFDRRVEEGRLVEGHGDLRPEHVCLTSEPAIIDCLEFSRELRLLDPADELAFLALECERLGAAEVGGWFLEAYTETTGDAPPPLLLRFHRTYRALRRAKIAVWHLEDAEVREPARWIARARRYLELATPPVD